MSVVKWMLVTWYVLDNNTATKQSIVNIYQCMLDNYTQSDFQLETS